MNGVIESRQLLAFATLARLGSFTAAAKELYLTQSAVSHAIKALETELGVRLFDRLGKRTHLTQAGERLLRHSEPILREMQDARVALGELQDWRHGRLRVGASTTACQYLLPPVLREFKQSFPTCSIHVATGDTPEMLEQLRSNRLELVLMLRPRAAEELEFRPLFEDELQLVVPPQHQWARQGFVSRQRIHEEPFLLYHKASYTARLLAEHFQREGIVLQNVMELANMEAIKELVKVGLGVGVIAPWVARKELEEGSLVAFPAGAQPLRRSWVVARLRGRHLALAEETFMDLCESVAETCPFAAWAGPVATA